VIVIPEAFGLVDDMRRDAHRAVGFVGRIPGFGHVEDAAEDAWSRVFAAFGKHLA
jgi:dienelactone hydrolase